MQAVHAAIPSNQQCAAHCSLHLATTTHLHNPQVVGSQGVDLQSTYKQLATARTSHALRFAAVYTDGGCDGMPDDLTYWVSCCQCAVTCYMNK